MFDSRELGAEFVGTFALVSAVCGAGLFSAPSAGLIAVAFAVGLSVLAMAYAVGGISGAHFNPAVTIGLVAAGRFDSRRAPGYIIAQVLGGAAAAVVFWFILSGLPAGKWNTFTAISNVYAGPALVSAGLLEVVITALFVFIIVSVTAAGAPAGFAPIAIGLALVLFH
ncbi:MAG: aquaporin, partial [Afipia sp.]|nr:aquaporin [Afipia sp.]